MPSHWKDAIHLLAITPFAAFGLTCLWAFAS
mgnify:CR=1 FL=1|jgi:hypothetical protein